jgi:hypothetical protein
MKTKNEWKKLDQEIIKLENKLYMLKLERDHEKLICSDEEIIYINQHFKIIQKFIILIFDNYLIQHL